MSRDDAHSLLNAAQAGEPVSICAITRALRLTGDFGPRQPERRDHSPARESGTVPAEQRARAFAEQRP